MYSSDIREFNEQSFIGQAHKITIHEEEDSIYTGPPLIVPKYSYEVHPEYRQTDKSLPFYYRCP